MMFNSTTGSRPKTVLFDREDLSLLAEGLERAESPRLRQLLEKTAKLAVPILRARRERGEPIDGVSRVWFWRRSEGAWRVWRTCDVEHAEAPADFLAEMRARAAASTAIDSAVCLRGPVEMLAGDVVRISAVDAERRRFSHDRLALVRADGSLGPLVPSLLARWPKGSAS